MPKLSLDVAGLRMANNEAPLACVCREGNLQSAEIGSVAFSFVIQPVSHEHHS